ncbi:MAG: 2-oxoacid:acceptor oxidoreductase family protein [Desulfovibrionales bacterium]|nr:2-oxoacid:acceptor oxidoreductase family protein [Desulfovibrionales bacterium]
MRDLTEIRWHGRGGQGVKTASLLLADAAFCTGKQVQGFPEYGPERMGAPITAYNRISKDKIRVHSNIYDPDFVVVVDQTLLSSVDVTAGLKESGVLIINSDKNEDDIRKLLGGYKGKLAVVNAAAISEKNIGKNIPNTPMLGAVVKISGIIPLDDLTREMNTLFKKKFASKPEVIDGNNKSILDAIEEVILYE